MIQDEYTYLNVSRQRKKQLRWHRDGKCIKCGQPAVNDGYYCDKHRKKHSKAKLDEYREKVKNEV